jgi:hypothetical protein
MSTQWEYKMIHTRGFGENTGGYREELNNLGSKGWELCGIEWCHLIFKRPVDWRAVK